MDVKTFREAYVVLQDHAQTLRDQTEPDIDNLLSIVTESVAAYKVCKERIDAVEKALEEALVGAGVDGGPRGSASVTGNGESGPPASVPRGLDTRPAAKPSGTGFEDLDNDVPF